MFAASRLSSDAPRPPRGQPQRSSHAERSSAAHPIPPDLTEVLFIVPQLCGRDNHPIGGIVGGLLILPTTDAEVYETTPACL
jgi:hypothetical protein